MKLFKNPYILITIFLLGIISSCNEDDDLYPQLGSDPKSIYELISGNSNLSTFKAGIDQVEMIDLLNANTTYTVLAPDNNAFSGVTLPTTVEEMENLMMNHVISTVTADFVATFTTGYLETLAVGPDEYNLSLFINANGELMFNGVSSLVDGATDIGATNGIIQTVNTVLTLPTTLDHITANPDYSMLAQAIDMVGLSDALNQSDIYTVMAPNNAAMEMLLAELNGAFGWTSLDDIPMDILEQVLQYHIVLGDNIRSEDFDGSELTTIQGEAFSVSDGIVNDATYTDANINLMNVQAINGVIQGVDKVLLPDSVFQAVLSATLPIPERCDDRGYTTFTQALEIAGLTDFVTNTQDLTAFAPNNGAFDIFFLTIENFDSLADFDTTDEINLLADLLKYHLHQGVLMQSDLTDGLSISTEHGDAIMVEGTNLVPTLDYGGSASISESNIGASNGIIQGIGTVLVPDGAASDLGYPPPATGGPVYGFEIYHDALYSGAWVGWTSPDFANAEQVRSGNLAIKNDMQGWEGFQIGGFTEDMTSYSTINFSVYSETGTTLLLVLNDQWGNGQTINVPAGEWYDAVVPISNVANGTTQFNTFVLQDQTGNPSVFYLDQIGFDITYEDPIPDFAYEIYTEALNSVFWIGWTSPDFANTENPNTGLFSVKLDYAGWDGFQIGGANEPLAGYSVFKFSLYSETGTTLLFVVSDEWGNGMTINVPAGEWTDYVVPIADVSNGNPTLDTFMFQDQTGSANTVYFDDMGMD